MSKYLILVLLVAILTGCSAKPASEALQQGTTQNTGTKTASPDADASAGESENAETTDNSTAAGESGSTETATATSGNIAEPEASESGNTGEESAENESSTLPSDSDTQNNGTSGKPAGASLIDSTLLEDPVFGQWYIGAVGKAAIHARFERNGETVTGEYYYDKYQTKIKLNGRLEHVLRDRKTIALTEQTDQKGTLEGVVLSPDLIQGYWKSGDNIHSFYMVLEGSEAMKPEGPDAVSEEFRGSWYGKSSRYFSGSNATFYPLFKDMMYYEMFAFNGGATGALSGMGFLRGKTITSVFLDKIDVSGENVKYEFQINSRDLMLNSNSYDYMCGMGVGFDTAYTREKVIYDMPSALEVGIVESEEMEKVFRDLTGSDYENFINLTQGVAYSEMKLDGKSAKAGQSIMRGMAGMCFYVLTDTYIYAACLDMDGILYYTNDSTYENRLPGPMAEWAAGFGEKIEYHYSE